MSGKSSAHDDGDVERVERDGSDHSYAVHTIHQNGHDIFYTTIPGDDLFPYTFVERFCENPEEGYQRRFDKRRAGEIAEYLATDGMSIPINVVLSAQPDAELTYTRKTKQLTYQRVPEVFAVINGQHRLWGYHLCKRRHRVPVAIYHGLDATAEARLFVDLNTKQKGVPKKLLKNVKSVAGTETEIAANPRRLFLFLNTNESSPLRGKRNIGESSSGKLSRISLDGALGRAQKSVNLPALRGGVGRFSNISAANYTGPAKRHHRGRDPPNAAAFFARIATRTTPHLHVGRAPRHPVTLPDSESVMDQTWSFCPTESGMKVIYITNILRDTLAFPVENARAALRASERGSRFGQHAVDQVHQPA